MTPSTTNSEGLASGARAENTGAPPAAPQPSPDSDRAVAVVVWISALILLTPVIVFIYVFFIRNRLLKG